jgi:hypothetical protein
MSAGAFDHAAYMRGWRRTHSISDEERVKDRVRSIAGVALRRGQIQRAPCGACGEPKAEMHHPDYSQPRHVVWLCRPCHLLLHRLLSATSPVGVGPVDPDHE